MTFTVHTLHLVKELQILFGLIPTSSTLPILQDFLFEIEGSILKVSATDLETSISSSIVVESNIDGSIAIPARMLMDILKILPDQPLIFEVNKESLLITIQSMSGIYKMAGESGDDFPVVPSYTDESMLEIDSSLLSDAIHYTQFAISGNKGAIKPAVTGLLMDVDDSGMTFVATDGFRLVKYDRKDGASNLISRFIIPKKAINLLDKALPDTATPLSVNYDNTNAYFSFNDTRLTCRLIDDTYPNYQAVIPNFVPHTMLINRLDFQIALRRILIFSNKTTYHVFLRISQEKLTLFTQDIDFSNEAKEEVICHYNGPNIEIAFNARFLLELLNVMRSEEILLRLTAADKAGIIVPGEQTEDEDLLMLAIPISYNNN